MQNDLTKIPLFVTASWIWCQGWSERRSDNCHNFGQPSHWPPRSHWSGQSKLLFCGKIGVFSSRAASLLISWQFSFIAGNDWWDFVARPCASCWRSSGQGEDPAKNDWPTSPHFFQISLWESSKISLPKWSSRCWGHTGQVWPQWFCRLPTQGISKLSLTMLKMQSLSFRWAQK